MYHDYAYPVECFEFYFICSNQTTYIELVLRIEKFCQRRNRNITRDFSETFPILFKRFWCPLLKIPCQLSKITLAVYSLHYLSKINTKTPRES